MMRYFNLIILLASTTLAGCSFSHLDRVPADYSASEKPEQAIVDDTTPPRLQIVITRNFIYSSHSFVRLLYNDQVLMWDPAGSYGDLDEHKEFFAEHPLPESYKKIKELVFEGAPSLATYFVFAKYTADNGMEVFEWQLPEQDAKLYYDILTQGALSETNQYDFVTDHPFLLCSSYMTRFLHRFVGNTFVLDETYFFPDSLAHELFEQHPDRILFFSKGEPVKVFSRPR